MAMVLVFIANVLYMFVISSLCASITFLISGGIVWGKFFAVFLGVTAIQLLFGKLYSIYIDKKLEATIDLTKTQQELLKQVQDVELTCSFCSTKNKTNIVLNKENRFDCKSCRQENLVVIQVATARSTKPLVHDQEGKDIFKGLDS